jgi:hypothetical protein
MSQNQAHRLSRPNQHQHTHEVRCLPSFLVAVGVWRLRFSRFSPREWNRSRIRSFSKGYLRADPRKQTRVDLFRLWIHVGASAKGDQRRKTKTRRRYTSLTSSLLRPTQFLPWSNDFFTARQFQTHRHSGLAVACRERRVFGEANFEALVLGMERFIVDIYHGT